MKKTALLLFVSLGIFAFSKENDGNSKSVVYGSPQNRPSLEVKGSPYLWDDYSKCRVGNNSNLVNARYNAVEDSVEFLQNGKPYSLYRQKEYSPIYFIDTKETLLLVNYKFKGSNLEGYLFQVFQNDKVSLFVKKYKKFLPEIRAVSSYEKDVPARYINEESIYYIKSGNEIIELPQSRKKLIEIFPEKKDIIEANLKTRNIDLSKKEDLQIIVKIFQ